MILTGAILTKKSLYWYKKHFFLCLNKQFQCSNVKDKYLTPNEDLYEKAFLPPGYSCLFFQL